MAPPTLAPHRKFGAEPPEPLLLLTKYKAHTCLPFIYPKINATGSLNMRNSTTHTGFLIFQK